jgi:hypothetical protein
MDTMDLSDILFETWRYFDESEKRTSQIAEELSEDDKNHLLSWVSESYLLSGRREPVTDVSKALRIASFCLYGIDPIFYNPQMKYEYVKLFSEESQVPISILQLFLDNSSKLEKYRKV